MASELLAKGDSLFVDECYAEAVEAYTQAAEADPNNARVFSARAQAHIKLEDYLAAVEDATRAKQLDPTLSNAYLRLGIASFHLEEYESAKQAFEEGARLAPEVPAFKTWMRKCQAELDDETEAAAPAPTRPVQRPAAAAPSTAAPAAPAPSAAPASSAAAATADERPADQPQADTAQAAQVSTAQPASAPGGDLPLVAPPGLPQFEGKYRHQWYQLQNKVTLDVYAKNLSSDRVSCSFGDGSHLSFTVRDSAGEEEYKLDVDLYGKVIPESCKCEVLKSKVEITMTKAETMQWGSLEKSAKVAAPNYSTPGTSAPRAYPSSYTKAPKDWDKVENELSEMAKKGELDDGDPLNNFFKKIFSQGDEDQRRAMQKSFLESNGTVLSTNWDEVGRKKVECTPPEGMEVKKYGS